MAKKKMPSEHRISGMNEGDIQVISNDFGDYVLVKLAYKKGDYGYNFIDKEKIHDALNDHMDTHNDAMQDAINDKTRDYINDNMEDTK